jgi:uncharacterized membrane protein YfcA
MPAGSLGFIYLPALMLIVLPSVVMAPIGARLSHRLPVKYLRILFALMLYGIAIRMLTSLW